MSHTLGLGEVSVGVGALAGSTIMLLTATWFMGMLGGRVDMVNGVPQSAGSAGKGIISCYNTGP